LAIQVPKNKSPWVVDLRVAVVDVELISSPRCLPISW
jgi:hypothetical protein